MAAAVALVRCADYAWSRSAIERALALIGVGPGFFRGKRAALKVNMMKGAAPERALCTHPEFVRALASVIRDAGGSAFVCDSSGILAYTAEAFEAAGFTAMCAGEGLELVDLDREPPVWRSIVAPPPSGARDAHPGAGVPHRLKGAWVGRAAAEADLLVTVPKLKTHTIAKLTCALKNHMGLLVGATKCRVHEVASRPPQFAEAVADLHVAAPCHLAVVDGILGLDGGGTAKERSLRQTNVVLAGRDPVAVDAVAADLIGLPAGSVEVTEAAARRGIGVADLERINVRGDSLQECRQSYEPAGLELKRLGMVARTIYRLRGHSLRPVVVSASCTACGRCAEICPVSAITVDSVAVIDARTCIRCYACRAQCPEGAIKLKCRPLLKKAFRARAEGLPLKDLL